MHRHGGAVLLNSFLLTLGACATGLRYHLRFKSFPEYEYEWLSLKSVCQIKNRLRYLVCVCVCVCVCVSVCVCVCVCLSVCYHTSCYIIHFQAENKIS